MSTKIKQSTNLLKILSRHPSHTCMRRRVLVPGTHRAVLRLGSETPGTYDIELNTIEGVQNCSNKLRMKEIFRSNEISSPEFYDADQALDYDFESPLVAKRTFRSGGKGMVLLHNKEELVAHIAQLVTNKKYNLKNPYYFEKYYNYTKEYRIHVSEVGGYFYSNRKMLKSDATERWFRNNTNSVWMLETNELFDKPTTWDKIVADCQKAREALGMSILGFDVRVSKKGDWKIIEANSACSFGDPTSTSIISSKYQLELCRIIQQRLMV